MSKEGEHGGHVTVERIHLLPGNPGYEEIAEAVAQCYRYTFGTDLAWGEGWACPEGGPDGTCAVTYRLDDETRPMECPDHHLPLVEFWPMTRVLADMHKELSHNGAVWAVARTTDGTVVGATWSFPMTADELEKHLGMQEQGFAATLAEKFPGHEWFLYLDEIFVDPRYQRRGIATELFYTRLVGSMESVPDARVCILRTKRGRGEQGKEATTYTWYCRSWGFQVVAEVAAVDGDTRDRVILGQFVDQIPERH